MRAIDHRHQPETTAETVQRDLESEAAGEGEGLVRHAGALQTRQQADLSCLPVSSPLIPPLLQTHALNPHGPPSSHFTPKKEQLGI